MIKAVIEENEDTRRIDAFSISGHANAGPFGRDIVCAAVSAVVQMALMGVEQVADGPKPLTVTPGFVRWIGDTDEKGQAILQTMALALRDIEKHYPKRVKVFSSAKEWRYRGPTGQGHRARSRFPSGSTDGDMCRTR